MKRTLLLSLGLALAATACGGDDGDTASAAPTVVVEGVNDSAATSDATNTSPTGEATDTSATAEATDEELAIAFADCMRDEGIDFPDDGREVYRFYIDELRKRGWGVQSQLNLGKTQALTANNDRYQATIQIQSTSSGSRVSIAFSPHG